MDFNYSRADEAFRAEFRAWLETNLECATPARDPLADEGAGDWEARVRWHRKLNEGGWMAINWPREYGGRGVSTFRRNSFKRPSLSPFH
jgi:alkylation response protein AidB-like acyl-CoA dehydrogenase